MLTKLGQRAPTAPGPSVLPETEELYAAAIAPGETRAGARRSTRIVSLHGRNPVVRQMQGDRFTLPISFFFSRNWIEGGELG